MMEVPDRMTTMSQRLLSVVLCAMLLLPLVVRSDDSDAAAPPFPDTARSWYGYSESVAGDSLITSCAGPTASLMINNPHDDLSPFAAAERVRDMRLKENGCELQSELVQPDELKCRLYKNCDGGNTVMWCPHELDLDPRGVLYPHNWPNAAAPTIVKFFEGLR